MGNPPPVVAELIPQLLEIDESRPSHQKLIRLLEEIPALHPDLALCYRDTARELEQLTGQTYNAIHIVGGGASAEYLNRLTARHTGKTVYAGPGEATAIGNLMAQMISGGEFSGLQAGRECVKRSFEIKDYKSL